MFFIKLITLQAKINEQWAKNVKIPFSNLVTITHYCPQLK